MIHNDVIRLVYRLPEDFYGGLPGISNPQTSNNYIMGIHLNGCISVASLFVRTTYENPPTRGRLPGYRHVRIIYGDWRSESYGPTNGKNDISRPGSKQRSPQTSRT